MGFNKMINVDTNIAVFSKIKRCLIKLFMVQCLLGIIAVPVNAQIAFSPTILFLDEEEPVKELVVRNVTDTPQEVEFVDRFGYPTRLSSGQLKMVYDDSIKSETYSLSGKLRIFPKKILIPPQSQQIVRLKVEMQENDQDQVYWSRIGIQSSPANKTVGDKYSASAEAPAISYLFRQNMGVYYKQGTVNTGVKIQGVYVDWDVRKNHQRLLIAASRTGNSPYLGIMTVHLTNQEGRIVLKSEQVINLFFNSTFPVLIDQEAVGTGLYRVDITFETARGDIPSDQLTISPAQHYSEELFIKKQAD